MVLELCIVCLYDIGLIGFFERENVIIFNVVILRIVDKVMKGFWRVMVSFQLFCFLYLLQNDGILIEVDVVVDYFIKIFVSGFINSMMGVVFFVGLDIVKFFLD